MTKTATKNSLSEVGKVIRIEYDEDEDKLLVVLEISDSKFKRRVLSGREYQDLISINGTSVRVMKVASKKRSE